MEAHQNAINALGILELQHGETYETWQANNPNGTPDDFAKDRTEVQLKKGDKTVTEIPADLVQRLTFAEDAVHATGTKGHWSLVAVGMLGGAIFCGGFFAFIFLVVPIALPFLPALGPIAVFLTASTLNLSLGGVGAFLTGAFICDIFHGRLYRYACEPAQLPEENGNPDSPPKES